MGTTKCINTRSCVCIICTKWALPQKKTQKNVNIVLFLAMIVQDFCNIFVIEYM